MTWITSLFKSNTCSRNNKFLCSYSVINDLPKIYVHTVTSKCYIHRIRPSEGHLSHTKGNSETKYLFFITIGVVNL